MALTLGEVYQLARRHQLSHNAAITAAAIAMAESGLNPSAMGDLTLQDNTWGPSVGLWQIRSYKSQAGTGSTRDAESLTSPDFNARSMSQISAGGTVWSAWSTWKNGAYKTHMAAAAAAAGKAPTSAPLPSGASVAAAVPSATGPGGDWDPLPGGSGGPGYADDLFGWVTGKAGDEIKGELFETALTGIVLSAAFGLGVTLVAVGAWRLVTSGSSS